MNTLITTWIVSLMSAVSPPDRNVTAFKGWEETVEERSARYEDIAEDLWNVVEEHKPLFAGSEGRQRTAALLLAVAFHESGFAKDVDKGPCVKTGTRCDGGASSCLMQVKLGKGTTSEGWTQDDLFADRKKCFLTGLRMIRRSFTACSRVFPGNMPLYLSSYAGGFCENPIANKRSRELWAIYERMSARLPIPSLQGES